MLEVFFLSVSFSPRLYRVNNELLEIQVGWSSSRQVRSSSPSPCAAELFFPTVPFLVYCLLSFQCSRSTNNGACTVFFETFLPSVGMKQGLFKGEMLSSPILNGQGDS